MSAVLRASAVILHWLLALAEWPDLTHVINGSTDSAYFDVLSPALSATRLTYTATHGSYRRESDVNATLPNGWVRMQALEQDPSTGGFHGLVFYHNESGHTLLAFRGSDLSSDSSSALADSCANKILWENSTWDLLPAACHKFSRSTLDYLSTAQAFTDTALQALRSNLSQTLFTGHSLGAGLAVLTAAKVKAKAFIQPKVLAFSAPAFDVPLRERVRSEPVELDASGLAIVYNEFDPLFVEAKETGGIDGITPCPYVPATEPDACKECYKMPGWNISGTECSSCFAGTHVFGHYLHDLHGSVEQQPRYRPKCIPVVAQYEIVE